MESNNNSVKLVGVLVLGAAVGAALGILFAPDKGSETRKKIANKSTDLTDAIKEKFDDLMSEVKKEVETLKGKAEGMLENGVEKAKQTTNHS